MTGFITPPADLREPGVLISPFTPLGPARENFVGRENRIREFWANIESNNHVLLLGPSGTGKTSLIHRLRAETMMEFQTGFIVVYDTEGTFDFFRRLSVEIISRAETAKRSVQFKDTLQTALDDIQKTRGAVARHGFEESSKALVAGVVGLVSFIILKRWIPMKLEYYFKVKQEHFDSIKNILDRWKTVKCELSPVFGLDYNFILLEKYSNIHKYQDFNSAVGHIKKYPCWGVWERVMDSFNNLNNSASKILNELNEAISNRLNEESFTSGIHIINPLLTLDQVVKILIDDSGKNRGCDEYIHIINCCIHLSSGQKRFPLFELTLALKFKPQNLILEPRYFQI
nr:hypothetical protein GZ26D8_41 [uncultured archaeon GZfos26D8]